MTVLLEPILNATRCVFLSTCPEIGDFSPLSTFWKRLSRLHFYRSRFERTYRHHPFLPASEPRLQAVTIRLAARALAAPEAAVAQPVSSPMLLPAPNIARPSQPAFHRHRLHLPGKPRPHRNRRPEAG